MKAMRQHAADLILAFMLVAVVIWYMMDAYGASSKVANLLLIFPIGIISLVFLAGILIQIVPRLFRNVNQLEKENLEKTAEKDKEKEGIGKIFMAMALLALYVLVLSTVGFDIATFLFMGLMLFVQGERRLFWLIVFPLIFSLIVSQFFSAMIPYPMPMALQTDWFAGLI